MATRQAPFRPEVKKHKAKGQSKYRAESQPKGRPSRRKRSKVLTKQPSDDALDLAQRLSDRVGQRGARVRFDFFRATDGTAESPPAARLLRGGRGGEVRLKLLLTLLWVAGGGDERHATRAWPARAWAALLDLDDPEGRGQRRVRDAIGWLEREGFLRTDRHPGRPMSLQLLMEDGSGEAYFDPAPAAKQKKGRNEAWAGRDLYVELPATFWTDGWVVRLTGRAIAMLLILREVAFSGKWSWVSPAKARERYGISEDTWSKGVAELNAHKIIEIRKKTVGEEIFDFRRVRNTYRLAVDEHRLLLPDPELAATLR